MRFEPQFPAKQVDEGGGVAWAEAARVGTLSESDSENLNITLSHGLLPSFCAEGEPCAVLCFLCLGARWGAVTAGGRAGRWCCSTPRREGGGSCTTWQLYQGQVR